MIIRISERCGPSRRRSMPLIAKRSSRRSALSDLVGSGQRGSGAASAARAAANGNAGRSPGSRRQQARAEQAALLRRGQERQLPPAQQVVHQRGHEHRLAALTQAGDRKAQDLLAGEPGEILDAALELGGRRQAQPGP